MQPLAPEASLARVRRASGASRFSSLLLPASVYALDSFHIVGDRVLIEPDRGESRTDAGLILPAGVRSKDEVEGGRIVKVGPGHLMANPEYSGDEPWAPQRDAVRYLPLQAVAGDYALFLRAEAIEIEYLGDTFLIVPHRALLALARPTHPEDADDFV